MLEVVLSHGATPVYEVWWLSGKVINDVERIAYWVKSSGLTLMFWSCNLKIL